jgi:hypothetical protein
MTKKHLTIAGLVIASGALIYEVTNKVSPKKEMIQKTAHIGMAIGLGLIAIGIFKKD